MTSSTNAECKRDSRVRASIAQVQIRGVYRWHFVVRFAPACHKLMSYPKKKKRPQISSKWEKSQIWAMVAAWWHTENKMKQNKWTKQQQQKQAGLTEQQRTENNRAQARPTTIETSNDSPQSVNSVQAMIFASVFTTVSPGPWIKLAQSRST